LTFTEKLLTIGIIEQSERMEGDSSFSAIAPPVFSGENYQMWAAQMEPYLEALDLWGGN